MSGNRFSATSVLDVTSLNGYYNRLDVFVSFTDDGDFDLYGEVDKNLRPEGVLGYMVNDVIGRRSRENTLYGRVFRYREKSRQPLRTDQYTMDDYEMDYNKLVELYPEFVDEIDGAYITLPNKISIKTPFAFIWMLTFYTASSMVNGKDGIKKKWAELFQDMGYDAILDKRAKGIISVRRKPCIILLGKDKTLYEDLEIVSTQKYKKEQNSRIHRKIAKFNGLTKVANARGRIKKW